MKHRAVVMAVAALGFVMMASAATASSIDSYVGTVVLNQGPYSSGYGGEFTGVVTPGSNTPVPGAVSTFDPGITPGGAVNSQGTPIVVPPSFQTFCIQEGVNDVVYYPGTPYYGILTTHIAGGPHVVTGAAAVLFENFSNGVLTGYDYNNNQALSRKACAGALQDAIWVAEGDRPSITDAQAESDAGISGNTAAIAQATIWYNTAVAYVSSSNAVIPTDVEILELYGTDPGSPNSPHVAQAQLVRTNTAPQVGQGVPLPSSAGVGFSSLAAFGALAALRKRLGRSSRIA